MATKTMAMGYEIETERTGACETHFVYLPGLPGEGRDYMGRVVATHGEVSRGIGSGPHTAGHVVRIVVRAGLAALPLSVAS